MMPACFSGGKVDANSTAIDPGVNDYILGLEHLEVAEAQPKTEIDCDGLCPQPEQDGTTYCSYKRYTETGQFDEFVAFQPNSATLWPGTVVRGADAQNGLLTPIGVDLAPVTFSLSLENLHSSPVGEMEKPSLSAFRESISAILADGATGATPAALDFSVVEVNSASQLSFALGAEVSWPGGPDIAASFSFDSTERKTKILVNFTQAYYTVDVDTHTKPSDFFAPGTTIDDLEPWMDQESPPVYVQSITYGRRVIFSVQTNRSASEVKAALEASYSAAGAVSAGLSVSEEQQQVLDESEIRAFVLGGSADDATGAIAGFEGLIEYIKQGGSYSKESPGAPIAYKLAYLDNAVTKLAFTTDYSERSCVKNEADVRVDLSRIKHVSGGDGPGDNLELFGNIRVRYPTKNNPVVDCNTGGEVAYLWQLSSDQYMSLAEGGIWTPSAATFVDLEAVPVSDDAKMCFVAVMWESDSPFGNDDFGIAGLLVSFKEGWPGEHHVVTHGSGENSLDVSFKVEMK
ncbi:MAG: hypothetical protein HOV80_19745 [Polyangiaceae bacterium]|nr:hypothetical protein [Polyangiaceae bacterium]